MKYFLLALTLLLTACGDSTEEQLRKQRDAMIKQQEAITVQQAQQYQQQAPQYMPQPVAQAPIIVQQPVNNGNSAVTDMLIGGMIGHSLANAGSRAPSYARPQQVTNVTRNVTINQVRRPSASRPRRR